MMEGVVSIIIPCFNAGRWLREAIDNCLAQTYRGVEINVVDDGSTDDSLTIIQSYGDKIRYESGPNQGGSHARNRGFALSHGDYIQYLDADDFLLPEKIEEQCVSCRRPARMWCMAIGGTSIAAPTAHANLAR